MKKFKLVGNFPKGKTGSPCTNRFTDENIVKELAKKFGCKYEVIYEKPCKLFDNCVLY